MSKLFSRGRGKKLDLNRLAMNLIMMKATFDYLRWLQNRQDWIPDCCLAYNWWWQ